VLNGIVEAGATGKAFEFGKLFESA
jgi:hypothetical protein